MTDLCFCIKTSCGACPDTPSDIPSPAQGHWTPNRKEEDEQPGPGRWEDRGTAAAGAPWALPLRSLVPGRGLHT